MVSTVIAALSVVVAAVYAFLTYHIQRANRDTVRAMQEQTRILEEQNATLARPLVSVSVLPQAGTIIFMLRIANLGRSAAERLRLSLDRDVYQFGEGAPEKNLRILNAFTSEIPVFAPGAEIWFYLGTSIQVFGGAGPQPIPQVFAVTAEYVWAGRTFAEKTTLDLRAFYGSALMSDRKLEALQEIAKAVQQIHSAS